MKNIQRILAIVALTSCAYGSPSDVTRYNDNSGWMSSPGLASAETDLNRGAPVITQAMIEQEVEKELLEKLQRESLQAQIKKTIDSMNEDIEKFETKLNKKKEMIEKIERDAWEKYNQLTMKQKMLQMYKTMQQPTVLEEMYGKNYAGDSNTFTIHLDRAKNDIGVFSDQLNPNGVPLNQFQFNTQTGSITETFNSPQGAEPIVDHFEVAPSSFMAPTAKQETAETNEVKEPQDGVKPTEQTPIEGTWDDLEVQKDLAFKIMYFFIVFIIATMGLLYAFFKMTKNQMEDEARRKGVAQKRAMVEGTTFVDFLSGRLMDDHVDIKKGSKNANEIPDFSSVDRFPTKNL